MTEIYLIDNHSSDTTKTILKSYTEQFSNIILIQNEKNVGYGRGQNLAIRRVKSQYHILCNPDIIITTDIFSELISYMKKNKDVGVIYPKTLNTDRSIQYLNKRPPTVLDLVLRRFCPKLIKSLFKNRLDKYEMKDVGYDFIYDVPFASGSFMFCRTDVLQKVNGFDERYFLYLEDFDLCRKIQNQGFRTVYNPTVNVIHHWERASYKNIKMTAIHAISTIHYFNKWGWKWC